MITKIQAKNNENFHLAYLSTVDKDGERDIVHQVFQKYKLKSKKSECFVLELEGKVGFASVENDNQGAFIEAECPICHPEVGTKIDESDDIEDLYRELDSDENK